MPHAFIQGHKVRLHKGNDPMPFNGRTYIVIGIINYKLTNRKVFMKHVSTTHKFEYQKRIWEMTIGDDIGKLISRKPPMTWDWEWGFLKPKKTPAYTMRMIRHAWAQIKDKKP